MIPKQKKQRKLVYKETLKELQHVILKLIQLRDGETPLADDVATAINKTMVDQHFDFAADHGPMITEESLYDLKKDLTKLTDRLNDILDGN